MESKKFKVVLLGEGRVGKTSLLLRYVENQFSERQTSTIQASYLEKRLNFGSMTVTLAIWDTAGQERFHALAPIYYRDAQGAILVYDITDATSFSKVQHWVDELRKIVGPDIIVVMAANKEDLITKNKVDMQRAIEYARSVNATLFTTSAKTGKGVEAMFLELTKLLLKKEKTQPAVRSQAHGGPTSGIIIDDDVNELNKPKEGCSCSLI